jgi:hypothetical protein
MDFYLFRNITLLLLLLLLLLRLLLPLSQTQVAVAAAAPIAERLRRMSIRLRRIKTADSVSSSGSLAGNEDAVIGVRREGSVSSSGSHNILSRTKTVKQMKQPLNTSPPPPPPLFDDLRQQQQGIRSFYSKSLFIPPSPTFSCTAFSIAPVLSYEPMQPNELMSL